MENEIKSKREMVEAMVKELIFFRDMAEMYAAMKDGVEMVSWWKEQIAKSEAQLEEVLR